MNLWGALWQSCNLLDGKREHLLYRDGLPALFHTRQEAREWIKETHGCIAWRQDLRREPHGWRLPRAVRITSIYFEMGRG